MKNLAERHLRHLAIVIEDIDHRLASLEDQRRLAARHVEVQRDAGEFFLRAAKQNLEEITDLMADLNELKSALLKSTLTLEIKP